MRLLTCLALGGFLASSFSLSAADERSEKVIKDRAVVQDAGFWIYDDLAKAQEQARTTGKPILMVLRCIP